MPKQSSYLQRRGDSLCFRIAVPLDLRTALGKREITKFLDEVDKKNAVPQALLLAGRCKLLFVEMREMAKKNRGGFKTNYTLKVELDGIGKPKSIDVQAEPHEQEAVNSVIETILGRQPAAQVALVESAVKKVAQQIRLSQAIPVWKRLKNPAPASVEVYEFAVRRFEGRYPDLFVDAIEKRHVREYIEWLQAEGKNPKTIDKEHGAIRALLNIARNEEWIASNPASGVLLPPTSGASTVRSYAPEELKQIFASPVFVGGLRPVAGKGEAAYWVPLLLLFTGARREEICQLTTDRIRSYEGVTHFVIDPMDDEGQLKTEESKRAVPVHDHLVRLGFLNYVAERVKAGGGLLFPQMKKNDRGQYGAKWGDWWRRYVRGTLKITDKRIAPAHSFRHLFITECRRLELREDYERALVGHAGGGGRKDAHDGYGEHLLPSLAAALNRIDFRGLDLSHLYPVARCSEESAN